MLGRGPCFKVIARQFNPVNFQLWQFLIGDFTGAAAIVIENAKVGGATGLIGLERKIGTMNGKLISLHLSGTDFHVCSFFLVRDASATERTKFKRKSRKRIVSTGDCGTSDPNLNRRVMWNFVKFNSEFRLPSRPACSFGTTDFFVFGKKIANPVRWPIARKNDAAI